MSKKRSSKNSVNSRRKGKTGELEWVNVLRSHGIAARRAQQYRGTDDSADVLSSLPIHWEVKRRERLNVYTAMEQAIRETDTEKIPVVAHRSNRREWCCTIRAEDFLSLVARIPGFTDGQDNALLGELDARADAAEEADDGR